MTRAILGSSLTSRHSQRKPENHKQFVNTQLPALEAGTFTCAPKAVYKLPGIKGRVCLFIFEHIGESGVCWWHRKSIAAELDCSESSVAHAIADLHAEGWITRHRYGRGGRGNVYERHFRPQPRCGKPATTDLFTCTPLHVSRATHCTSTEENSVNETQVETVPVSPAACAIASAGSGSGEENAKNKYAFPSPSPEGAREVEIPQGKPQTQNRPSREKAVRTRRRRHHQHHHEPRLTAEERQLLVEIVHAHPKGQHFDWPLPRWVTQPILAAAESEMRQHSFSRTEALLSLLTATQDIAAGVPAVDHRYIPGLSRFFEERAYRLAPISFSRTLRDNPGMSAADFAAIEQSQAEYAAGATQERPPTLTPEELEANRTEFWERARQHKTEREQAAAAEAERKRVQAVEHAAREAAFLEELRSKPRQTYDEWLAECRAKRTTEGQVQL